MSYREEYEGTRYKYIEGMEEEIITQRYQREDFIERLVFQKQIAMSDLYLMRAVSFFRICTARMVAEWILYYRNRYGEEACSELPLPKQDNDAIDISDGFISDKFVTSIEERLSKLGNLSVLIHTVYLNKTARGGYKPIHCYIAAYPTFNMCRMRFEEDEGSLHYIGNYLLFPAHRKLSYMHTGSVAIRAFMKSKNVEMKREEGVIIGSMKEVYIPDMRADQVINGQKWIVMIEGLASAHDPRDVTDMELGERIRNKVKKIKRLLHHDAYVLKKYEDRTPNRHRVILCTDTWATLGLVVRIAQEEGCVDNFNEKVFVVSDAALRKHGNSLKDSCVVLYAQDGQLKAKKLNQRLIDENPWIP